MSPSDPLPASRVAVVLGMHRSGTSAVAGALAGQGVDFGPRLMPATEANQKGYFEHIDVVNLHDRVLLALGRSWDDVSPFDETPLASEKAAAYRDELLELLRRDFSAAACWGIKDPRLCHLLPWWEPIWAATAPVFIIVLRSPAEIADSLVRREGFSAAKAHLLTVQHLLAAERFTRGQQRVFIEFDVFLTDWRSAISPALSALGLPSQSTESVFVNPCLRRSRSEAAAPALVQRVEAALRQEAADPGSAEGECDAIRLQLAEAAELYDPIRLSAAPDQEQALAALSRQAVWYEQEWQKARRRVEAGTEKLGERQKQVETLQNSILRMKQEIANVRMHKQSNVRKRRGSFVCDWFRKLAFWR